ncbi:MAG: NUDIX hydrolase [Clostridia bacterium]|nr:NUDIX hydrolase [Clostridia bacterium]
MDLIEKCVRKNYIYQGKIVSLRCDDALLPNGEPCKREIIEHSGGACVLYEEEGKILFVRQYRYAYGEVVYEIPAGKLNAGEDPALAAARELEEETGVTPTRLELLYIMYPTPGYTNEKIYIFRAFGGKRTAAHPDEGEFLETCFIPVAEVEKMLIKGEIKDGKTIVAVQAYLLAQKR